ncbi:MAG: hypothetical protein WAT79_16935 [Saprospiraceae bacterium]
MVERKVISALLKLNKSDTNQFGVFVHSPYFNVHQDITLFFETLQTHILFTDKKQIVSDEFIWDAMYPNVDYDGKRLNRLVFLLGNLLDRFIGQKEFEEMVLFQKILQLENLNKNKLHSIYSNLQKEFVKFLDRNMDYSSENSIYSYFALRTVKQSILTSQAMTKFNRYYILEKLNTYVTLLSWKKMYKLDVELHFMDYVFDLISEENYAQFPSIQLYTKITHTLKDEEETSHYFMLRNLMKEHIDKFPIEMQREMYTTALSYCINKVNQFRVDFYKEVFDLFKESVENNIIQENNEITVSVFRNIVIAALRVGEFEWTEQFIVENKKYVNPKFRDNAVYFSFARLEMHQQKYSKVLEYLQLINYDDVWYQLGAKTMLVSAYYELKEFDALESLLNAYKMFINREKSLTKERKTSYLNLIKYTKKLLYILPSEKSKIEKLRKEIEGNRSIVNKAWLLECVDELKVSRKL